MAQKILGIDIRNDTVSAVLIKSGLKTVRVEAYHSVAVDQTDTPQKDIGDALTAVLKPLNISGAICAVSLPADRIFFRNVTLPFKDQKKIRQVLRFELEPSLPVSAENLIIDFTAMTGNGEAGRATVFAAALDNSTYKQFSDMLAHVNVKPDLMTFSHFAGALCWARIIDPFSPFLLAHVDMGGAAVFVIDSGSILFMRCVVIPQTDRISPPPISAAIRHTLLAYESVHDVSFEPSTVILAGPGSKQRDMATQIEQDLKIPVKKGSMTAELPPGKKISLQNRLDPDTMEGAISLALLQSEQIDGINFSKGRFSQQTKFMLYKNHLIATGILLCFICLLGFATLWIDGYRTEKKVAGITRQITALFNQAFPEVTNIVDPLQQMRVKVQDMKNRTANLQGVDKKLARLDIIKEISIRIPSELDTEITRFTLGDDQVLISGNTDTFNTINEMKSRLESSAFFQEVVIGTANFNRSGKRVDFTLNLRL